MRSAIEEIQAGRPGEATLAVAMRAGVTRRVQPGRPVQGVHADAGVVGERRHAGGTRRMARLDQGILDEGQAGLVGVAHTELCLCDELHAVHHNFLPISRGEMPTALKQQFQSKEIRSVHPVVRVHPETGEKALFVNPNFTSHIVELSRAEGRHLLELLYEHLSNPAYTCRFRWEPGSLAMWDNRCTQHAALNDTGPFHRLMRRVQLQGDIPA